ncbi:unnamed protein product [Boreogadus saida]
MGTFQYSFSIREPKCGDTSASDNLGTPTEQKRGLSVPRSSTEAVMRRQSVERPMKRSVAGHNRITARYSWRVINPLSGVSSFKGEVHFATPGPCIYNY